MRIDVEELQDRDYLGDGVYAGHDGFHVILWVEGDPFTGADGDVIGLDPNVRSALNRYIKRVGFDGES